MKNLLIITIALLFSACSIFQPSETKEEITKDDKNVDEVYVFDEVSETEDNSDKIKELEKDINNTLNNEKEETVVEVDAFGETTKTVTESNSYAEGESFFLQLGAFSSLKNAEQYVGQVNTQVPFVLSIIYNSQTSLYTVRSSKYPTKEEVEVIRDDFWSKGLFKDAFIVTE